MHTNGDFQTLLRSRQGHFNRILKRELRDLPADTRLAAAVRYSLFNGGKRIRPLLAYAAAEAVGGHFSCADIPACAIELIHTYSLIHDDLPAMDDDRLRRGVPTCHVAFDEATAILAGDALQAQAFSLLSASPRLPSSDRVRLRMLRELAAASGMLGMVGGQALDIAAQGGQLQPGQLSTMHAMKTGALIAASIVTGALSTNTATAAQLDALREYARLAGLAFQIRDDILDVETGARISGKEQGGDARLNKPTYPSTLGLEGAKSELGKTCAGALELLEPFAERALHLKQLTLYIVERKA